MIALIITLIIVGILLLAAELLIIPGFGIAGILGVVSIIASCYLAFASVGHVCGIIVLAINIILVILSTVLILRSETWKKATLKTNISSKVDSTPQDKGLSIGQSGTSLTRLAPSGKVQINDNIVEVFTRDSLVEPGKEVEITEFEGNKIFVKEK